MENVLIIMSDEHQRRALGSAGHPVVQTPNLDALAAGGTTFTNCWTPSPICVPARASLATGKWVHDVGAWDSAQAYSGEPKGWADALARSGYDVASFGKLHHRSGADDDGFTERHLPMFIHGGLGWLQGLPRREPIPYVEAAEMSADVGTGETTYTRYDRRVAATACDWLRSTERTDRPWAAFVSFVAPHYPLSAPEEFAAMYPLSDVPPPEIAPMIHRHPAVAAMQQFFSYGDSFDDDSTIAGRAAYFALCSFVDHHVGLVLDALEAAGQRENTRIIYTSDHGELLGNRGLWAKSFMYEDSVAVPLIINGPGVPAGKTVDANVNLVDVAPTAIEAAQGTGAISATALEGTAGESLWHRANNPQSDRIGFSEYHDGGSITGSFAIRSGEWKYVHHQDFAPEFYNIADDPDELIDLGTSAEARVERAVCARQLGDVVDTAAANTEAFATQDALIAKHGGREQIEQAFRFNHTPAP